ncbi:nitronate monooxygenase [Sphingomonas sp. MA1305]|uniref:NAD(P)H-dependent flavin oxidoreductase n=1 Tax=Sphingomonas sp. MA1305 TaxID=2479204 RepID=UPI0018E0587D|nr:nitronate monooxygenase [Sphingomonas sp. MA1305]MBI0475150.1 nitronate monooxygenase [Sphingomonas sp. MA1305]
MIHPLLAGLGVALPILQAPMAGVSTAALAAAVSNAGGLGAIAIGALGVDAAQAAIAEVRARTDRAFNVNVFVHATPTPDPVREAAWIAALAPSFAAVGAQPPVALRAIYTSFGDDAGMRAMLLAEAPPVVSFHFGLPDAATVAAFQARGTLMLATATSLAEAQAAAAVGIDAIVAQGIEAGGHRGHFDPAAPDDALGTLPLTRLLVRHVESPIIAAGGIMDGAGIAAALDLGAIAAQLGTAFIGCPESAADAAYRAGLAGPGAWHTRMTDRISGRPARALPGRFDALADTLHTLRPPDYPIAYDAGKALHVAARSGGESGYGAYWAGQGAPLSRPMPAAALVATLASELAIHQAG